MPPEDAERAGGSRCEARACVAFKDVIGSELAFLVSMSPGTLRLEPYLIARNPGTKMNHPCNVLKQAAIAHSGAAATCITTVVRLARSCYPRSVRQVEPDAVSCGV